jgi:hypothetical protein
MTGLPRHKIALPPKAGNNWKKRMRCLHFTVIGDFEYTIMIHPLIKDDKSASGFGA